MSTKIYNAFIYNGNIEDLMRWLFKKREQYKEFKKREAFSLFKDIKSMKNGYFAIAEIFEKATKEQRNAVVNYEANACVYFYKDEIYINFMGLPEKLIPRKTKSFIDFHYQNSTDKPEKISEKEWRNREKIWDAILKYNTFGENGLIFQFTPPYFGFEIARHLIDIKSKRESNGK